MFKNDIIPAIAGLKAIIDGTKFEGWFSNRRIFKFANIRKEIYFYTYNNQISKPFVRVDLLMMRRRIENFFRTWRRLYGLR